MTESFEQDVPKILYNLSESNLTGNLYLNKQILDGQTKPLVDVGSPTFNVETEHYKKQEREI